MHLATLSLADASQITQIVCQSIQRQGYSDCTVITIAVQRDDVLLVTIHATRAGQRLEVTKERWGRYACGDIYAVPPQRPVSGHCISSV